MQDSLPLLCWPCHPIGCDLFCYSCTAVLHSAGSVQELLTACVKLQEQVVGDERHFGTCRASRTPSRAPCSVTGMMSAGLALVMAPAPMNALRSLHQHRTVASNV